MRSKIIYVLCGGGPAPGWNNAIRSLVLAAHRAGYRVIGIFYGFKNIRDLGVESSMFIELTPENVDRIAKRGGSIIGTSRKGLNEDSHSANVLHALDSYSESVNGTTAALVALGGNDTFVSAMRVAQAASAAGHSILVFHGTKTIDNDLFAPERNCSPFPSCPEFVLEELPSFGFSSSTERFAAGVSAAYFDALNESGRYIVARVMGRDAGWLTWATAALAQRRIQSLLMPGEVQRGPIVLMKEMLALLGALSRENLSRMILGAMLKDRLAGQPSGAIVVAEGVADCLDDSARTSLEGMMVAVDECDHGHKNYSRLPFEFWLEQVLEALMVSSQFGGDTRRIDNGYDGRCIEPNEYDLQITTQIGEGIIRELQQGTTAVSVYGHESGYVCVPFADSLDPQTNKMRVREVPEALWRPLTYRFLNSSDLDSPELAALLNMPQPQFREFFAGAVFG